MIKNLKNAKLIQRFLNLKQILNQRNLKTSTLKRSGNAAAEHNHGHHEVKKVNPLFSWFIVPEHPKVHQGYVYREAANLQGATNASIAKLLLTVAWAWMFYKLWKNPEATLGHMEYPNTAKWTNAELGIPDDDEE